MKTIPMTLSWRDAYKKKVITPDTLAEQIQAIKSSGKTVATLNGSFDLLHAGHLHIIFEASKVADVLIVLLNTDESIRRYKSADRPIVPLKYRLELIAALECIDYVTWFDETDPRRVLAIIKPDVHVNGQEYGPDCIERDVVVENGGRLHLVERIDGLATSQLLKKIKSLCD